MRLSGWESFLVLQLGQQVKELSAPTNSEIGKVHYRNDFSFNFRAGIPGALAEDISCHSSAVGYRAVFYFLLLSQINKFFERACPTTFTSRRLEFPSNSAPQETASYTFQTSFPPTVSSSPRVAQDEERKDSERQLQRFPTVSSWLRKFLEETPPGNSLQEAPEGGPSFLLGKIRRCFSARLSPYFVSRLAPPPPSCIVNFAQIERAKKSRSC